MIQLPNSSDPRPGGHAGPREWWGFASRFLAYSNNFKWHPMHLRDTIGTMKRFDIKGVYI
jgi:hypothetical protein